MSEGLTRIARRFADAFVSLSFSHLMAFLKLPASGYGSDNTMLVRTCMRVRFLSGIQDRPIQVAAVKTCSSNEN